MLGSSLGTSFLKLETGFSVTKLEFGPMPTKFLLDGVTAGYEGCLFFSGMYP